MTTYVIVSMSELASQLLCGDDVACNQVLDVSKLSREVDLTAATVRERIGVALTHWSEWNCPHE